MTISSESPEIADARKTLLKHYGDQQSSQGTRLIGFVAGLFTLLQLTQAYKNSVLHSAFSNFPPIILFGDVPMLWDFLKVIFLFLGTTVILYFILRTIFRFSFYGHMVTAVTYISEKEMEELLKEDNEKETEPMNELVSLHLATTLHVYKNKKIYGLKACLFVSLDGKRKEYPNKENTGICILGALSGLLSFLLLLFLW